VELSVEMIVILSSSVVMLSPFDHSSSTVSGSTPNGTVTEQITSCLCPLVFCRKPLGWKEIIGTPSSVYNVKCKHR